MAACGGAAPCCRHPRPGVATPVSVCWWVLVQLVLGMAHRMLLWRHGIPLLLLRMLLLCGVSVPGRGAL